MSAKADIEETIQYQIIGNLQETVQENFSWFTDMKVEININHVLISVDRDLRPWSIDMDMAMDVTKERRIDGFEY
jgi:hypothetical protein